MARKISSGETLTMGGHFQFEKSLRSQLIKKKGTQELPKERWPLKHELKTFVASFQLIITLNFVRDGIYAYFRAIGARPGA